MNFFAKDEIKALAIIFGVLIIISIPNFAVSIKRSRDLTRKNDLASIDQALGNYQNKFKEYPSGLSDLADFLPTIPRDPESVNGVEYVYLSNGRHFQILAYLEDKFQDEYDEVIEKRNISCGVRLCNFGRSDGQTPLDKSIEEYEQEISM